MNKKMSAVFVDCTPDIAPLLSKQIVELAPPTHIYNTEPLNEDELIDRLQPYAIAVVYMAFLSEKVLVSCPKLKSVVYLSTGLATHVDMEAASRLGIDIHGIKGYGDRAVAEHTIALMFAAARKIGVMDRGVRGGSWFLQRGFEVQSRTFGVIGLGGIGIEVARIAYALGMRVIGWNRSKIEPGVPCHILDVDDEWIWSLSLVDGYNLLSFLDENLDIEAELMGGFNAWKEKVEGLMGQPDTLVEVS